jgi:hypothetical protein
MGMTPAGHFIQKSGARNVARPPPIISLNYIVIAKSSFLYFPPPLRERVRGEKEKTFAPGYIYKGTP